MSSRNNASVPRLLAEIVSKRLFSVKVSMFYIFTLLKSEKASCTPSIMINLSK